MNRKYDIKTKRTFRENLQSVIPQIFDDFFKMRKSVIEHPRRKDILHQMRITGKPLRYILELGLDAFGAEFKKCQEEYKNAIELLGDIHDCDVVISELVIQLNELRNFNIMITDRKARLSVKGLRDMLKKFRVKRNEDFEIFKSIIKKWETEDFGVRIIRSMGITEPVVKKKQS